MGQIRVANLRYAWDKPLPPLSYWHFKPPPSLHSLTRAAPQVTSKVQQLVLGVWHEARPTATANTTARPTIRLAVHARLAEAV